MTSQWSADDALLTKVSLLLLSSPLFISSFLHPLPLVSQSPKVNVEGTNNIIRLCLEKKFKKLVYLRFYLIFSSFSYILLFDFHLLLISLIKTMYTSSIAAYAPPHGSYITEKSLKLGEFILLFFSTLFFFILFYFFINISHTFCYLLIYFIRRITYLILQQNQIPIRSGIIEGRPTYTLSFLISTHPRHHE